MTELIETGKVSARGQVAIPAEIRQKMHLKEGQKILFVLTDNTLLVKKVEDLSWEQITKPLREAKKKIEEKDVVGLVHKLRKRE